MSTHIQCPSCGTPAADIASPDERWGMIYDDHERDLAAERCVENTDGSEAYEFSPSHGRQTFECACGNAVWIALRGVYGGRWFVGHQDAT